MDGWMETHRDFRQVVRIAQLGGDVEPEVAVVLDRAIADAE